MHPQPLFTIFGRGIYPYGICFAVGIILCFAFLFFAMKRNKFNDYSMDAIIVIGVVSTMFGLLCAALLQALYNYIENPSAGFRFGSGITFMGGLVGGVLFYLGVWNLYVYVVRPKTNIAFFKKQMNAGLTDALPFIPIGITIAHAFGRFGCFWAGCCYGNPTDAWYGLPCAAGHSGNYVPTQLFEMFFLIALSAVMAYLYFKYKFNYNFAVYGIAYGIWRFILEFYRSDDRGAFLGSALTPSQFWSIIAVLAGVGYIFLQKYILSDKMKHPIQHADDNSNDNKDDGQNGQTETDETAETEQSAYD